jgi:hypothetical protein
MSTPPATTLGSTPGTTPATPPATPPSGPRRFTEAALAEGAEVPATPNQAHYLGHVMRRGVGDRVRLFNGQHGEWAAEIAGIRKDRATFRALAQTRPQAPEPVLHLLLAAVKRDAMDWIAEKATELGIGVIQPVLTRRSITDKVNVARLTAIAQEHLNFETLEERKSDSLDFKDVGVLNVKAALKAAYAAGRASAKRKGA